MIRERIYETLSADSNLAAAIDKIRPIVLEESDTLPSVTYRVEIDHDSTFDGNSGLKKAVLETNVFADSLAEASTVNGLLKTAAASISGVGAGITVFNIYVSREIENFDDSNREYQINTQFTVNYKED